MLRGHSLFHFVCRAPRISNQLVRQATLSTTTQDTPPRDKSIEEVKKLLRKEGLKKKVRRKFETELRIRELSHKIHGSSTSKGKQVPKEGLSVREKFQQLPYDASILSYIRKHTLHRTKEVPVIRQSVNSFVDKVRIANSDVFGH